MSLNVRLDYGRVAAGGTGSRSRRGWSREAIRLRR
jgi:hypothetical protein